jgi:peptide/nickel transport system ATP-binding protein
VKTVLDVRNLTTRFATASGSVAAVNEVSFALQEREILGLVGESGSGKSVTLRSLIRLLPSMASQSGEVIWDGHDILKMAPKEVRAVRGGQISMIFQEPSTALNPVLPIGLQIDENLRAHTTLNGRERQLRARELMDLVGIPEAARRLTEYPHQFSGGMKQRAMIAISLASNPRLLLADEPTTALDVTIQDQILKLILDLRDELAMSVIFVTHDLGVVAATCDRMAVMYAGRIVEAGTVADVFARPMHAYTRGLLGSVPRVGTERSPLMSIEGTPPSLSAIPQGCAFNPRCDIATEICRRAQPPIEAHAAGHEVACHNSLAVVKAGSPVQ